MTWGHSRVQLNLTVHLLPPFAWLFRSNSSAGLLLMAAALSGLTAGATSRGQPALSHNK